MENVSRWERRGYKVKEKGFTNNTSFCILSLLDIAHCCRGQNEPLGWFYVTEMNYHCFRKLCMYDRIADVLSVCNLLIDTKQGSTKCFNNFYSGNYIL